MTGEHGIGYKRPPQATRFAPGRSGNPSGRPKRRPTFQDALLAELAMAMPGSNAEHGRSKLQALVRTLVDAAIAGNARAQSVVVAALARIGDVDEHESATLTPDDEELLKAFVGDELQRHAAEGKASKATIERPIDGEQPVDAHGRQNKRRP